MRLPVTRADSCTQLMTAPTSQTEVRDMTDIEETLLTLAATALMGPLLKDEEIACAFATLILRRLHGNVELAKQQPFRVTDQGASWMVMGSYQEPGMLPDTGAWCIEVRKSDCRVEKFGHYAALEVSEEVKSIIANAKGAT